MDLKAFKKYVMIFLGTASLVLGSTGIFIPVLPTTPFFLLSAYLYLRSSHRLYQWLINHRLFGRDIYDYITYKAVRKKVKINALIFLWLSLTVSAVMVESFKIKLLLCAVGIGVTIHLIMLKNLKERGTVKRAFKYDIMEQIKQRWSTRAIDGRKIAKDDIMALIEAARYAPSCFNEQPWRFKIADDEETLQKMRSVLNPSNQVWANNAPVLILIASKKNFSLNNKENYWHMFDAGTAWGYLSLEAQKRGLAAHAMGGFSIEAARRIFEIPRDYSIITVVAVGQYGKKELLSEEMQKEEHPNVRKEAEALLF